MPAIFETLTFAPVGGGSYDFVPNDHQRVTRFGPAQRQRSASDMGRMQAHGDNPRNTLLGGLEIQHEGMFLGPDIASWGAERDTMIAAILGDLTVPPADTKLGDLTVQYAWWTESATGAVTLDSWAWELLVSSVATSLYQLSWKCFDAYFIGDTSGDPKQL